MVVLYAASDVSRSEWVRELRKGARTVPVSANYEIGRELGRGRFSKVYLATHNVTGMHARSDVCPRDVLLTLAHSDFCV